MLTPPPPGAGGERWRLKQPQPGADERTMVGWLARKAVSDEARNWGRNRGQSDVMGSLGAFVAEGNGILGKLGNLAVGLVALVVMWVFVIGFFALIGFVLFWVLPKIAS